MDNLRIQSVVGGPLEVNTYVVALEESDCCVIIDPGVEASVVKSAVDGRKVCAVLLTHAHFDHMLYAQHWLDLEAKLYVHRLDAPALCDKRLNLAGMIGSSLTLPQPDVLLDDGDVVEEAGLHFNVIHTPGHTPGGVCYQCGDVLFSGDTMFYRSYGRIDFPGGDGRAMLASLARLKKMNGDITVYPGHGVKTKIAWERGI